MSTQREQDARIYSDDRDPSDPCQRGTAGCCINHTAELDRNRVADSPCETW